MRRYVFQGFVILPGVEVAVPGPMDLGKAIGYAEATLPACFRGDSEDPQGLALFPPRQADGETMPYVIQLREGYRDARGNPPRVPGQKGVIGCLFRDSRGIVIRCWFAGDEGTVSIGPVDVRSDAVATVPALYRAKSGGGRELVPLDLPGWAVARMDTVTATEGGILLPT